MLPSKLLLLVALTAGAVQAESWNYKLQGQDWPGQCAAGLKQSPIDIEYENILEVSKDKPFKFINYDQLVPVSVRIGHHTVKVTPTVDYEIAITGGGLPGKYILDNIHFHWGSEHLFGGYRFPLEAHFVHYKSIYNGTADALAQEDPEGLAVLGVMFEEAKENLELNQIDEGARHGQTVLDFEKLLPLDPSRFFRYRGSLTTPPCSEAVVWTVFKIPVPLTEMQVAAFRGLLPENEQVIPTYRAVQKLNRRRVELWSTGPRNLWGINTVRKFTPDPSLLFAVVPGLSNSLQYHPNL